MFGLQSAVTSVRNFLPMQMDNILFLDNPQKVVTDALHPEAQL